jgi:cupin fold WbuC family metalloprotein
MLGYLPFDNKGTPEQSASILLDADRGTIGVDSRPGVWHTFFALVDDTVVFEVKPGPYDNTTDKDFAVWAPSEDDPNAAAYLMQLEDDFRAHWKLPARSW